MKRSQDEIRRQDRRSAILSQRISDKERAQLNRLQRTPRGAKAAQRKEARVAKRVQTVDNVRLQDQAAMLPRQIQRDIHGHMDKALKEYERVRKLNKQTFSLETIESEKKQLDPLYDERRASYAQHVYGTAPDANGGRVAVEHAADRTRPLQFLGVDHAAFLMRTSEYEHLALRLPQPASAQEADGFYVTPTDDHNHVLGRNLELHTIVRRLEDLYDLTLFELHLLGRNALPDWLPHRKHASGMLGLDFWFDEEGHFLLRFLYATYAAPDAMIDGEEGVPGCRTVSHADIQGLIKHLSRLDELAERATLTRPLYHKLQIDLKMQLGQVPLQGLAYYYMAPSPNSDAPLDETWQDPITV